MKAQRRIYRKVDGSLCYEGDPEAAFLAFAAGDEVPDGAVLPDDAPARKQGRRPADKNASARVETK